MTRVVLTIAVVVGSASGLPARQTEVGFDVASIRPASPDTPAAQRLRPGRLDIVSTQLRTVVTLAFGVEAPQVIGPNWLATALFDIQATFPAGAGRDEVPQMVRALLTERFGLVARVEQRLVDGYELVVSEGGLEIQEVEAVDELAKDFGRVRNDRIIETLDGPVRQMPAPSGVTFMTSRTLYSRSAGAGAIEIIDAARITMSQFANLLAANVDRPVIDGTGLTGVYAFRVELDTPPSIRRSLGVGDPTGVSTFAAVENLGLELEQRRVPLDFVVIEHIERTPTEN